MVFPFKCWACFGYYPSNSEDIPSFRNVLMSNIFERNEQNVHCHLINTSENLQRQITSCKWSNRNPSGRGTETTSFDNESDDFMADSDSYRQMKRNRVTSNAINWWFALQKTATMFGRGGWGLFVKVTVAFLI